MGSSNQQTAQPYQLPNQAGSAAAFQAGAGELQTIGNQQYSAFAPAFGNVATNVMNNPYYAQAQAGAQGAANQATNVVAPQQFGGAQQDSNIATADTNNAQQFSNWATQAGQGLANEAQSLMPQATAGAAYAPQVMQFLSSYAPQLLNQGLGNANQSYAQSQQNLGMVGAQNNLLNSGAAQTLNTAYDPQSALYNRSYQQMLDQTNAINAQNGVTGSPFAAGVGASNSNNFNIDWQNAQLARQEGALGAAGTAFGQATGDVNNTLSTGANDYNTLSTGAVSNGANLINSGVANFNALNNSAINNANSLINTRSGVYNAGINTGVGALNTLNNQALTANTDASNLGVAGLNTLTSAAQAPSDVYLAQQQANLGALSGAVTGSNAALSPFQTGTQDQQGYLQTGINAATAGSQVATANNNAQNGMIGNILSGVGTIASMIPW